jgi:hypothetical protein
MSPSVTLVEVSSDNWRDVADLGPRDGTTAVGHVRWGTDEDGELVMELGPDRPAGA